jgi:hypothetical protein
VLHPPVLFGVTAIENALRSRETKGWCNADKLHLQLRELLLEFLAAHLTKCAGRLSCLALLVIRQLEHSPGRQSLSRSSEARYSRPARCAST